MTNLPEVKGIYKEIQKKLYYMIPEKWTSVHLYASIIEKAYQMPIGEMYFYYFPKRILRRNPVNVYEIPAKFNIDEKQYMKLVKNLYDSIEELRKIWQKNYPKLWNSLTISIENFKFKVEYDYEPIENDEYTNYDRHIIWRYKYLDIDINTLNKKDRAIIERYLAERNTKESQTEIYEEAVYKEAVHNILDYDRAKFDVSSELETMEEFESERKIINNQILAGMYKNDDKRVHKEKTNNN